MRAEEVADRSRLSVAARYESLVGVSNTIGTHRDPQDLFSALFECFFSFPLDNQKEKRILLLVAKG